MENNFFAKQTKSSKIKANIVSEYFPKYCNIISRKGQNQIRYVDLFAGPGIYDDGSLSTPILVGKACSENDSLSKVVWLIFNDNEHSDKLKENFEKYFPKGTFKHEPIFRDITVGENEKLKTYLSKRTVLANGKNPHPSLLFIDPFGYKGIDTRVLAAFMQNWGNEIFLFVNIKRIHAAVENGKFDELMESLFPTTIQEIKKDRKYKLRVEDRLNLIIDNLAKEYTQIIGKLFYTAFRFQEEDSSATSHYILHFTKHSRGYDLIKQIYHDFDNIGSTLESDGTYTFDAKKMDMEKVSSLNFGDTNILSLSKQLTDKYTGKKISALNLFDEHQASTKFSRKHYYETLRWMVENKKVISTYTDKVEHKVSVLISEHCLIEFI